MTPILFRTLIVVGGLCLIYVIASIIFVMHDQRHIERQEHEKRLLLMFDELNKRIFETAITVAHLDLQLNGGKIPVNRAEAQWKDNS